jgi:hypothetical protein
MDKLLVIASLFAVVAALPVSKHHGEYWIDFSYLIHNLCLFFTQLRLQERHGPQLQLGLVQTGEDPTVTVLTR